MSQAIYQPDRDITAVILAGGRSRRMGGVDKGLYEFRGRPMIEHVLEAIAPQAGKVIISANRNLARYRGYGYPLVTDIMDGYAGPLAGIASGMRAADTPLILCVPCDAPFIPGTLAAVLSRTLTTTGADICVAQDGVRMQQLFALLRRRLLPALQAYLDAGGRRVDSWYTEQQMVLAGFTDRPDAFINLNSEDDIRSLAGNENMPRVIET